MSSLVTRYIRDYKCIHVDSVIYVLKSFESDGIIVESVVVYCLNYRAQKDTMHNLSNTKTHIICKVYVLGPIDRY